ncbi:MAG: hypothetical protein HC854_09785 [Flavobacterium sp.]|nr:hypothetical protein [Flavobacterium sp.]
MKKIFLFFSVITLLLSTSSCTEDTSNEIDNTAYLFKKTTSNLGVTSSGSFVDIQVGVTTKSDQNRTFTISVDPMSTATANMYSIDQATLFIPAGEYSGSFRVNGVFANIPNGQILSLILNLSSDSVLSDKKTHTVSLFRVCPSDLAGTYSTLASGTYGQNGVNSYSNLTSSVTLNASTTAGRYTISDMSFGLYSNIYMDASPSGRIEDICNSLSDLGDVDQYNDRFTIFGSVNETTGVITLTWSNTYGDSGNVVLTPQ